MKAERIALLEEQNKKLTETVVHSVDLVANYKRALIEMREQVEAMVQMQMISSKWEQYAGEENKRYKELTEEDEEEEFDQYELMRKKTTIH
tara:strand:- start:162 stop:434 length:273 start_codon:yes stop_codon:yes gene_type:complete